MVESLTQIALLLQIVYTVPIFIMLGLFADTSSCTSRIHRLDLTSVTDGKSYVVVHQFILCMLQVPICVPMSALANPHLSTDDPVKALKLPCKLLHYNVHRLIYNRSWNVIGQFWLTTHRWYTLGWIPCRVPNLVCSRQLVSDHEKGRRNYLGQNSRSDVKFVN